MNFSNKQKGYWALAAISFLWGTTWFVSKWAVAYVPPLQMSGIRQCIAGCGLLVYYLARGARLPNRRQLRLHLLGGFLLFTCSNGLTTWAISYIPSFLGALIGCLMPFVLTLANTVLYKERAKPIVYLALLIGFSGVTLLLLSFAEEMKGQHFILGIALSLISVFTWTAGTLLVTRKNPGTRPMEGVGSQMLFGGTMLLISARVFHQHTPLAEVPWKAWMAILYLIVLGSVVSFACYLYALRTLPISLVSIYVYINPIVALLLGVLFLHEKITLQIVMGIAITLSGIYLVRRFSHKSP